MTGSKGGALRAFWRTAHFMTQSKPHRIRGQEDTINLDILLLVGCWMEQARVKRCNLRSIGEQNRMPLCPFTWFITSREIQRCNFLNGNEKQNDFFLRTDPGPGRLFAQLHLSGKLLLVAVCFLQRLKKRALWRNQVVPGEEWWSGQLFRVCCGASTHLDALGGRVCPPQWSTLWGWCLHGTQQQVESIFPLRCQKQVQKISI